MTCVTRKEVERSEPFEKGLDLKSVWGHHFSRNRYYISMICIIVVYLYPPCYPPFCFNSEINLLRARAPARRRHVNAGCVWIGRFYTEGNVSLYVKFFEFITLYRVFVSNSITHPISNSLRNHFHNYQ